jgi:hypothetical protein
MEVLRASFPGMKKTAAPGVDERTWIEPAEHLEVNLLSQHVRVHTGAYRALPSRRKYKAVNNRDKNFTRAKAERRRAQLEESIARYLSQLDTADRQEPTETLEAVADRGYFGSLEILACHEAGITVTLPKPQTSGAKSEGRLGKQDFAYLPEEDAYRFPAGERRPYLYKRRRRQDAAALLDHSLSKLFTQIAMHDRARAADYAMGCAFR